MVLNKPVGMTQFNKGPKMSAEERIQFAASMDKLKISPPEIPNIPNTINADDATNPAEPVVAKVARAVVKKAPKKAGELSENSDNRLQLVHWRFDKDDVEALKNIAEGQHGTTNKLVRAIISEWLEKNGNK